MKINYNLDVLKCLANLSNDEVFTPPEISNKMLDLLPNNIWSDKNIKFLDPCCKSGIFLREIAKRLISGLSQQFPDLEERINHIMHNQIFGIAITELTSLLSRRSLYCSKYANCKYSISHFNNVEGNIRYKNIFHLWRKNMCLYCGASKSEYGNNFNEDNHAYELIHTEKIERIFNDMKFDVIIGNPPYQLNDGGAQASAKPIYQLFVQQAKKLNPKYLSMIIPSRWFSGGKGLEKFREEMLNDKRMKEIHDFPNSKDCFKGVDIKGGVNYFLWDSNHNGKCIVYTHNGNDIVSVKERNLKEKNCNIFIRINEMISIFEKVSSLNEKSFSSKVSSRKPYGLSGDIFKETSKYNLPEMNRKEIKNGIKIHGLDNGKRSVRYVGKNYPFPKKEYLNGYKIFVARNQGNGLFGEVFSDPIFAGPDEACTETFIVVGPFKTKNEMENCWSYIKTKFFRAMVGIKKNDQGASQGVYEFVPLQNFQKKWTDEELYKKYNLSKEEIDFIETNVERMV